ncbi:MAG: hypothetical protein IJW71_06370 [Clostridia bacterium]|nr:hypothetical protein [Clostridia bacterium]
MPIQEKAQVPERAFFAAANGYDGFRSEYAELFPSRAFDAVFTLKGGPGTGKSSLMRACAKILLPLGFEAEYFYCSSDPASLDAVILTKGRRRAVILDGTAPHTRCADVPGIIDEIVNLGDYWDADALKADKTEILRHMEEKSHAFSLGYAYLGLAGSADTALMGEMEYGLNHTKLRGAVERFARRFGMGRSRRESHRIITSVGMRGIVQLKTPSLYADDISVVNNPFGVARHFYRLLLSELSQRKIPYIELVSPFSPNISEGVILPEHRYAIINGNEAVGDGKYINMNRFLCKDVLRFQRRNLRRLAKMQKEATDAALDAFATAGEHHFVLESFYTPAMDFGKKEIRTAEICEKIADICTLS